MAWNRNKTCQNDNTKYTNAFASLDIKGLYTQIQLNEVIEDILKLFTIKILTQFYGSKITKIIFRKILNLCSQSFFL